MPSFINPRYRFHDTNGDPIASGELNFYAAGTSNAQNTYSDVELTTPNANPVILDGNGMLTHGVYLDPALQYKAVLTSTLGATVYWTEDSIDPPLLATTTLTNRINWVMSDPMWKGATGDGVADDTVAVQAAIDAATSVVDLLGKTYKCDSQLTYPSGVHIRNGTIDGSGCDDNTILSSTGGSLSATVSLTANATAEDTQLTLTSTSAISEGDWLVLHDSQNWAGSSDQGEWVRVKTVDSSTLLTLDSPIMSSYVAASSGTVELFTTLSDVKFSDLTIIGNPAASSSQWGLYGTAVDGLTLDNVTIENCKSGGLYLENCQTVTISGCTVKNMTTYGMELVGCGNVDISHCYLYEATTGIYIEEGSYYPSNWIDINHCKIRGVTTYGIHIGESASLVDVSHCQVLCTGASSVGIFSEATAATISNNLVRYAGSHGIRLTIERDLDNNGRGVLVDSNVVDTTGGDGIRVATASTGGTMTYKDIEVIGNRIIEAGAYGIYVLADDADTLSRVTVDDNRISNPTSDGIYVNCTASTATASYVSVSNNLIHSLAAAKDGIIVDSSGAIGDQCVVKGNLIDGAGSHGVEIDNFSSISVMGNSIDQTGTSATGVLIRNGASGSQEERVIVSNNIIHVPGSIADGIDINDYRHVSVIGNIVVGAAGVNDGITVENSQAALSGLIIMGNTVELFDKGIYIDSAGYDVTDFAINGNMVQQTDEECLLIEGATLTYGVISGNSLRRINDTTSSNIYLNASTQVVSIALSGNLIESGVYGVNVANGTTATLAVGNVIAGNASGDFNGTLTITDNNPVSGGDNLNI